MEGCAAQQLHVFFFPLLATGHMLPLIDLAAIFAERGAAATIVTTHGNAPLVRPAVDLSVASGRSMRLLLIRFPAAESGLPEGLENTASLPKSHSLHHKFFDAIQLLHHPLDLLLREHRPDCLVSDALYPWTSDLALSLGIPRIAFHGFGAFPLCITTLLGLHAPHEAVSDDATPFVASGDLPHRVELTRAELPLVFNYPSSVIGLYRESEIKSYGVVVNSFYELEPEYVERYKIAVQRKVWCVGPASLRNRTDSDKVVRGGKVEDGAHSQWERIKAWLDSKAQDSVLYASFSSEFVFTSAQLREIGLGLEAAGHPFIWVVKSGGEETSSEWMPEGIEGKGLIVRRWAPQMAILEHPAVGGFMTHCGWNSVMEAVSAGVPMVAWPLHSEQFITERLVVDVLRIGARVLCGVGRTTAVEKEVVEAAVVRAAVGRVMDGGEEASGMKLRAKKFAGMARSAMEVGGSSYEEMGRLIDELSATSVQEKKAAAAADVV